MSKISTMEPSYCCNFTHWTNMEKMKWSSSGFLGVLASNNLAVLAYGFGLNRPNFWPATVPRGHGMSKISHTEPSQHGNITHWTHMEEMKWFSSAMLDVLVANNLGFHLMALAEICQSFGQQQIQEDMACPKSAS